LIELLMAVLIMALMSVLGWSGLDSILRTRATLSEQLAELRDHHLAFAQLEVDCAQIARSATVNNAPTLSAGRQRLVLLRRVSSEGAADELQVVVYRSDGGRLTRAASPALRDLDALGAAWQAALGGTDRYTTVTLDAHIAGFDIATWSAAGGWLQADSAPAARGPRVQPRRVVRAAGANQEGLQVTLRLEAGGGELVRLFLLGAG
jgi:general secretion pathway protein J